MARRSASPDSPGWISNSQVGVDFSKVPRIPGDGAYATSDEDIEAHSGTKIHITPAPKLKPLHFDAVAPEMFQGNGNTLSPSIIKHGATPSVDIAQNNAGSCSSSNHLPTEGEAKEGESVSQKSVSLQHRPHSSCQPTTNVKVPIYFCPSPIRTTMCH